MAHLAWHAMEHEQPSTKSHTYRCHKPHSSHIKTSKAITNHHPTVDPTPQASLPKHPFRCHNLQHHNNNLLHSCMLRWIHYPIPHCIHQYTPHNTSECLWKRRLKWTQSNCVPTTKIQMHTKWKKGVMHITRQPLRSKGEPREPSLQQQSTHGWPSIHLQTWKQLLTPHQISSNDEIKHHS